MATILIVDDERPVRDFLAMVMKDAGHHPIQAIHGGQALLLIGEIRPDLVISDSMMPVLDGMQLCRQLKAAEGTKAIPVILMSSASLLREAELAGADAFVAKPFNLDEMEALVKRLLPPQKAHKMDVQTEKIWQQNR